MWHQVSNAHARQARRHRSAIELEVARRTAGQKESGALSRHSICPTGLETATCGSIPAVHQFSGACLHTRRSLTTRCRRAAHRSPIRGAIRLLPRTAFGRPPNDVTPWKSGRPRVTFRGLVDLTGQTQFGRRLAFGFWAGGSHVLRRSANRKLPALTSHVRIPAIQYCFRSNKCSECCRCPYYSSNPTMNV